MGFLPCDACEGDFSANDRYLIVKTSLNHYDKDCNLIPDYEKDIYTFEIDDDCKCVTIMETKEEKPVSEKIPYLKNCLGSERHGSISLTIHDGKLTEILITS